MAGRDEDISDEEILRFFAGSEDPVYGTKEVAKAFEFTKSGIRRRLYKLSEVGYLDSKKIGNSPAFWITDEGLEHLDQLED